MTQSASAAEETTASPYTKPYRLAIAFALLAINALLLLVALEGLLIPRDGEKFASDFDARSATTFGIFHYFRAFQPAGFVSLLAILLPLLAVLLVTHISPLLKQGKLVVIGALASYTISVVFGVITLVGTLVWELEEADKQNGQANALFTTRGAVEHLFVNLMMLSLLGLALFFVVRTFVGVYLGKRADSAASGAAYAPSYPSQGYNQQPAGYAPAGYPAQGYPTPGYAAPGQSNQAQAAQAQAAQAQAAQAPTGPAQAAPGYAAQGYGVQGYAAQGQTAQGQTAQGYGAQGYGQPAAPAVQPYSAPLVSPYGTPAAAPASGPPVSSPPMTAPPVASAPPVPAPASPVPAPPPASAGPASWGPSGYGNHGAQGPGSQGPGPQVSGTQVSGTQGYSPPSYPQGFGTPGGTGGPGAYGGQPTIIAPPPTVTTPAPPTPPAPPVAAETPDAEPDDDNGDKTQVLRPDQQ